MPEITDITTMQSDSQLIAHLMQSDETLCTVIPEDIDADTLRNCLRITSNAYGKAQKAVLRLKPILGRILLIYKQRPAMFKDLNYHNFDDWMTRGVIENYGIARAEAFACVKVAEELSDVPANKLEELGMGKLKVVSSIVRNKTRQGKLTLEMREDVKNEWIGHAEKMTVRELIALAEKENIVDEGELDFMVSVYIDVPPPVKEKWERIAQDPGVQSFCGTNKPGVIFDRMMQECESEWLAQYADSLRSAEVVEIQPA